MTYDEAVKYIHSAPKLSKILGNESLRCLLGALENPQKTLKFVHVAGTNGKGSVCAMLDSVLRASGVKTGLFTSPYLEVFNERIRSEGENIPDFRLAELTDTVKKCMEKHDIFLSEFALILVIALMYFKSEQCDVVILETGLGGRLDATNVIDESLVSVITSIGLDHMQYLGNTKQEIAAEKCGIIKNGGKVVLYPLQDSCVSETVHEFCSKQNACLFIPELPKPGAEEKSFLYEGREYSLSLGGHFQPYNAAVAIKTAQLLGEVGFPITDAAIRRGLAETIWPGRFEWLSDRLLLDGCHNEDGAAELVKSFEGEKRHITLVTAMMKDKAFAEVAKKLSELSADIIVTELDMERAVPPSELAESFERWGSAVRIIEKPSEAVRTALEGEGICVVCGSLYLIGDIRRTFGR